MSIFKKIKEFFTDKQTLHCPDKLERIKCTTTVLKCNNQTIVMTHCKKYRKNY